MSENDVDEQPRATNNLPTEDENEREATADAIWPISLFRCSKAERPRFFFMFNIFLIIAYIYSVLRDMKDAVVIERLEPASISFLKSFFVTPASIVCVFGLQIWFTKSKVTQVLRGMICIFGGYFLFYAIVILPFQSFWEFSPFRTIDAFGDGKFAFRGLTPFYALMLCFNFWTSSLFYVSAELWGNLILSMLFMSYSNDVLTFRQSLRFVPMFYIGSNIGLLLSGSTILMFCYIQDNYSYYVNRWIINSIFLICGLLCGVIVILHYVLETRVLNKQIFIAAEGARKKKKKVKVGFYEGIVQMCQSRLLLHICFVILSYNICTNLADSVFKSTMKIASSAASKPAGSFVMKTQAENQIIIACIVILILVTPFNRCIQIFGWFFVGSITPTLTAILSMGFMGLALYNTGVVDTNHLGFINDMFSGSTKHIKFEKVIGQMTIAAFKITKYAFFDIAKEAISMRIDKENRPGYKAIYDGICGKLGKSIGGWLNFGFLMLSNSIDIRESAQYIVGLIAIMSTVSVYSFRYMSKKYNESVANQCDIDMDIITKKKKKQPAMAA